MEQISIGTPPKRCGIRGSESDSFWRKRAYSEEETQNRTRVTDIEQAIGWNVNIPPSSLDSQDMATIGLTSSGNLRS
jgi:hypothetical protein